MEFILGIIILVSFVTIFVALRLTRPKGQGLGIGPVA